MRSRPMRPVGACAAWQPRRVFRTAAFIAFGMRMDGSRKRWLKAHSRFHLHFIPTSASWLNMVERFFAEITRIRIRRGAFTSVAELKSGIMEYLEKHNADPKPFIWTKSVGEILEKAARAKQVLESQY